MLKRVPQKRKRLFICLLFLLAVIFFCYYENNAIIVSEYECVSEVLPDSFDGCKIVHLSDLHNKMFGKDQSRLIKKIKAENPDMIVITGDLIDSNHPDVETGLVLAREAAKIAPVYFVTGNHDNWLSDENTYRLFHGLEEAGVTVLKDEKRSIAFGDEGETISLIGIDDDTQAFKSKLEETLQKLTASEKGAGDREAEKSFTITLAHQPQLMPIYSQYDVDVVLCGHAHGGQFRIPFIGGFVAPDQGFLPKYTKGVYEENGTTMIVSCGLGNSVVPLRLLNRPELVTIILKKQ